VEKPVEQPVEQLVEQSDEQETLCLLDRIHLQITAAMIIVIIGKVGDNDALRNYNMQN
jgi:hypothetical protein